MSRKMIVFSLIAVLSLVMAGCFGGAGNIGGNETGNGTVAATIEKQGSLSDDTYAPQGMTVPSEATNVRVRIVSSNQNVVNDRAFNGGSSVSVQRTIPVGNYEVQAISYKPNPVVSSYGQLLTTKATPNIVVSKGQNTVVNIVPTRYSYTITGPTGPVTAGETFEITVSWDVGDIKTNGWSKLFVGTEPWDYDFGGTGSGLNVTEYGGLESPATFEVSAPWVDEETTLYYQARISLYTGAWKTNESDVLDIYAHFPSLTYGDTLGSVTVVPADGGGVDI